MNESQMRESIFEILEQHYGHIEVNAKFALEKLFQQYKASLLSQIEKMGNENLNEDKSYAFSKYGSAGQSGYSVALEDIKNKII